MLPSRGLQVQCTVPQSTDRPHKQLVGPTPQGVTKESKGRRRGGPLARTGVARQGPPTSSAQGRREFCDFRDISMKAIHTMRSSPRLARQLSTSAGRAALLSLREGTFAKPACTADVAALTSARLVIVGEIHSAPACIALQCRAVSSILDAMPSGDGSTLHIVLEHFNFEMQAALSAFETGSMSLAELESAAHDEGHAISDYAALLGLARDSSRIRLHAGFIPRSFARQVMRESLGAALDSAKAAGYIRSDETCAASEAHYGFFESLLTGRNPHDPMTPPSDRFRAMFPAQVLKDAAMAHRVSQLVTASAAGASPGHHPSDQFLVVCGVGHSGYSHGVPERIFAAHPELASAGATCRVWCLPLLPTVDFDAPSALSAELVSAFGPAGASSPAELCLAFTDPTDPSFGGGGGDDEAEEEEEEEEEAPREGAGQSAAETATARAATAEAYQAVGETAHLAGDMRRARAIMCRLGYSTPEMEVAGADAHNFQGVGAPHRLAAIGPGESVLDLGSGLGVDSFIAAHAVGEGGRVVGVDLAASQVRHTSARAIARGLDHRVAFQVGDLERSE